MRFIALCLALAACGGSTPVPPTPDASPDTVVADTAPEASVPCGGLCGPGTVCEGGRCVMVGVDAAVDSPTAMEATVDAADVAEEPASPDVASPDAGVDAASETGGCERGFGDCDGNPSNGCETNLANGTREGQTGLSRENCGMCRRNCAAPTVCCAGMCFLPDASVSGLTCSRLP